MSPGFFLFIVIGAVFVAKNYDVREVQRLLVVGTFVVISWLIVLAIHAAFESKGWLEHKYFKYFAYLVALVISILIVGNLGRIVDWMLRCIG